MNFINQRNEPHHKKLEQPSFKAVGQKTLQNDRHLKNPKIRDKCMVVSLPNMPDCHTFVSYCWVFQMSGIPRVFGQHLHMVYMPIGLHGPTNFITYSVSITFKDRELKRNTSLTFTKFTWPESAGEGISKTFLSGWGWGMPLDHPRSSPASLIMWAYSASTVSQAG